ncbi:MAG TPA: carboxypeptidase regulatory-like domain-containing protein, partial [Candidatus Babeliales bacterium]|nr:carboxypeptidase regulatory-like domain-containing protein [Candidatus Babeliales bacterium]
LTTLSNVTTYTDNVVTNGTTYYYKVSAVNSVGESSQSGELSATIPIPALDTIAPTGPTNLVASVASAYQVNLAWNASSDNVGVTRYDIYRSNTKIDSMGGGITGYRDASTLAKTSYSYVVYAYDGAGNKSTVSNKVSVTTPTVVTGLGSITGRLTNNSGAPLASVKVSYSLNGSTKSVSTNSSGNYVISSLTPGSQNLTYSLTSYVSKTQTVAVVTNANTVNDLQLAKLGSITGMVKDSATDTALSNVIVSYQLNGLTKTVKTSKGTFTINSLPAGTYNLTFALSGYNSQTVNVSVSLDQKVTKDISLIHI